MHKFGGILTLSFCLASSALAQSPQYFVTPAVRPGGNIQLVLVGQPGHAFATYIDMSGGPTRFLGEQLFLGLSPALTVLDTGSFGIGGIHLRSLRAPAAGFPAGVVFYLQALVLDRSAPNGVFRASNGESTQLYNSTEVMVEEFSDPVQQGYTGDFDHRHKTRLVGRSIRRRLHTVKPSQGIPFGLPLIGPLNPNGARVQMVYRAVDLGTTGEPEVVTALHWLPFGKVHNATFKRLVLTVGHTRVVPDFTIDPRTALPQFPNSGLDTTFARNPKAGETPVRIFTGSYSIRPQDVRSDGYLSYPAVRPIFTYNGADSLLLDFKMETTPGLISANGQQIQLMVLSSARPNARVHASGTASAPVNPHTVVSGRGDNSVGYMQFEFTRVQSMALSPWRKAPVANPDYHKPTMAWSVPAGARIDVQFRGADDASGSGTTVWTSNIDHLDRKRFLQYRITLLADAKTGAVPSIEALVIPIN